MEKEYFTVGEVAKLGLLMSRNGPMHDKVQVLRRIRLLPHKVTRKHGQRRYEVLLSTIIEYNATKNRSVNVEMLDGDSERLEK